MLLSFLGTERLRLPFHYCCLLRLRVLRTLYLSTGTCTTQISHLSDVRDEYRYDNVNHFLNCCSNELITINLEGTRGMLSIVSIFRVSLSSSVLAVLAWLTVDVNDRTIVQQSVSLSLLSVQHSIDVS
jgi:hypothetical protein